MHRGAAPVANRAMSAHTFPELGPFDLLRAKPIKPVISEEDEDRDDILDTGDIDPRYRLGKRSLSIYANVLLSGGVHTSRPPPDGDGPSTVPYAGPPARLDFRAQG